MLNTFKYLKANGKKYPFVFNINIVNAISEKYGRKDGLKRWGEMIQPKSGKADVSALIFMATECINEGIDMENDPEDSHYVAREKPRPFITEKQAARIISAAEDFDGFALETLAESNGGGKEEKNQIAEQS